MKVLRSSIGFAARRIDKITGAATHSRLKAVMSLISKFVLASTAATVLFFGGIAWWINGSDTAGKADLIVVLSGGYSRSFYAATLYSQGFAPEIWVSQPKLSRAERMMEELKILFPHEPAVHTAVLAKRGVPMSKIHLYGPDVDSTVDEAIALRKELGDTGKKILVVTSSYHVRRSRIVFGHYFPHAILCVVASPYEDFELQWWRHKDLAQRSILEPFKMGMYLYHWLNGSLPPG